MGRIFLDHIGGTRLFSCANCDTILTNRSELISTRFTGATGRAFLFNKVVNLQYSEVQDRVMLTGRHMVRDVSCKNCNSKLGWIYEFATEDSQRYKEGRVILERALVRESEGFEEHVPSDATHAIMGRYSGKTCRLILMLVITVIFFVAEIVAGYMGNSIALVSDSFNMLSDILSLCVGLTAARVSRRAGSGRFTYGMGRAEVVGALANAAFLAALCFSVSMESLKRLAVPQAIDDPPLVLIVGSLGLAVNVLGLLIFQDCSCLRATRRNDAPVPRDAEEEETGRMCEPQAELALCVCPGSSEVHSTLVLSPSTGLQEKKAGSEGPPLNIRGVLLHVLNDALGSVVVVVASALFYVWPLAPESPCNWQCYVDPSLTLVMVVIIMLSAAPLVKETAGILLQMSPPDLPLTAVLESVCRLPGVASVHEAHVWELSKGQNVASLHVKVSADLQDPALQTQIQQLFHRAGVHSVTVQLERADGEMPCCPPASRDVSEKQKQISAKHKNTKF
ncbi:zinc transporter 10-like [Sinocyclocheilus grahami]|nr:PREDICTED: zinc transporter 10-like [Sinocyclocheilus grahami]